MKAIIFDYDGVIQKSFEFHRTRIEKFVGVTLSKQLYKDIHNGNFFKKVPPIFKDVDWVAYRDFVFEEQSHLVTDKKIKKIILTLAKKYPLFIVSSGGAKTINAYLKNNHIAVFKEVLGLEFDHSKEKKIRHIFETYGFTSDECLFITDTLGDVLEAKKLDLRAVAVDYGFHDRATLERGDPFRIISDLDDVFGILQEL